MKNTYIRYEGYYNYYTYLIASLFKEEHDKVLSLKLDEAEYVAEYIEDWIKGLEDTKTYYYLTCEIMEYALSEVNYLEIAEEYLERTEQYRKELKTQGSIAAKTTYTVLKSNGILTRDAYISNLVESLGFQLEDAEYWADYYRIQP